MPYTTTTLAEMQYLLAKRYDDSVFWTDEESRLAINEALRDWNLLTGRWRRRVTVATAAASPEVDLPASIVYGMRVRTTDGLPVDPTSVTEMDLAQSQWRQQTTATGGDVPTRPTFWMPEGMRRIAIWPATAGVSALSIDGVSDTPVLVDNADFIDISDDLSCNILDFAIHILAFKEGGPRWARTHSAWADFLRAAAWENRRLHASQLYKRIAGLDRRRDLQPQEREPSRQDEWEQQVRQGTKG